MFDSPVTDFCPGPNWPFMVAVWSVPVKLVLDSVPVKLVLYSVPVKLPVCSVPVKLPVYRLPVEVRLDSVPLELRLCSVPVSRWTAAYQWRSQWSCIRWHRAPPWDRERVVDQSGVDLVIVTVVVIA